jgi:hypothetical protein
MSHILVLHDFSNVKGVEKSIVKVILTFRMAVNPSA